MKILTTLLLIFAISFTVSAQKTERSSADDDFTTTPFQDVSSAKGLSTITEGYFQVLEGIYVEEDITISIPQSFNPTNGERFTIDDQAMIMKMTIYTMNGEKVHESKVKNSWNGRNDNGEIVENGLYVYTINARITPSNTSKITGFIRITN